MSVFIQARRQFGVLLLGRPVNFDCPLPLGDKTIDPRLRSFNRVFQLSFRLAPTLMKSDLFVNLFASHLQLAFSIRVLIHSDSMLSFSFIEDFAFAVDLLL